MKRYLLFKGEAYYPSGGASDFWQDCDELPQEVTIADREWCNALDTETDQAFDYTDDEGWIEDPLHKNEGNKS